MICFSEVLKSPPSQPTQFEDMSWNPEIDGCQLGARKRKYSKKQQKLRKVNFKESFLSQQDDESNKDGIGSKNRPVDPRKSFAKTAIGSKKADVGTDPVGDAGKKHPDGTNKVTEGRNVVTQAKNVMTEARKLVTEGTNVVTQAKNVVTEGTNVVAGARNVVTEARNVVTQATNVVMEAKNVLWGQRKSLRNQRNLNLI